MQKEKRMQILIQIRLNPAELWPKQGFVIFCGANFYRSYLFEPEVRGVINWCIMQNISFVWSGLGLTNRKGAMTAVNSRDRPARLRGNPQNNNQTIILRILSNLA